MTRTLAAAVLLLASCASAPSHGPAHYADARGAWSDASGAISIDAARITTMEKGDLVVRGFVREEPGGVWVLRNWGRIERWRAAWDGATLVIGDRHLTKLPATPPELDIRPATIVTKSVTPERAKAIADEILARNDREQKAMRAENAQRTAEATAEVARVQADNLAWIRTTVAEVGWLDAARFGAKPSALATVMLKHSGNHALPLVLGALPQVERDFGNKASGSGQMFEILYDSLQLQLGGKQRYGTQLAPDANGNPYVLPVDDLAQVPARREAIGDMPWDDYLALVSKTFYGGKPVSKTPPVE